MSINCMLQSFYVIFYKDDMLVIKLNEYIYKRRQIHADCRKRGRVKLGMSFAGNRR